MKESAYPLVKWGSRTAMAAFVLGSIGYFCYTQRDIIDALRVGPPEAEAETVVEPCTTVYNQNTKVEPEPETRSDVDFGPYMHDLDKRLKHTWPPPKGHETTRVKISFQLTRRGNMSRLRVERTSGIAAVDNAAMKAVQDAAPFAPLPQGSPKDVDIQYTFDPFYIDRLR